jgi:hypothetical protein
VKFKWVTIVGLPTAPLLSVEIWRIGRGFSEYTP